MLNIYTGHVSALCPQVNDRVLEQLSESRRKRVLSMRNEQGKCQSAAAGLLLKRALGDVAVDIQAHSIVQGEHGKPVFKDIPLYFNLSHAGDCVVCALADEPVGIDVEHLSRFEKRIQCERLMERILTEEEKYLWKQNMTVEAALGFWTRKESYVKMTGKGLTCDFKSVDTLHGACYVEEMTGDGYRISVCTEKEKSAEATWM